MITPASRIPVYVCAKAPRGCFGAMRVFDKSTTKCPYCRRLFSEHERTAA